MKNLIERKYKASVPWSEKQKLHVYARQTSIAKEENLLNLRQALWGAIHHLQGQTNLIAAAQALLLRRNSNHQHNTLIEAFQQIIDHGYSSIAALNKSLPEVGAGSLIPVNLNQILQETILLMTTALTENGIALEWHSAPGLPLFNGIENQLLAVFKQLIENAIEAMNQDGIFRRNLGIFTWSDAEFIYVGVEDTGPGIPEHLHVKVFEPFFTTKTDVVGYHPGIGLAWVQDVINQHSGLIQIDPKYSEGCRIIVQFQINTI